MLYRYFESIKIDTFGVIPFSLVENELLPYSQNRLPQSPRSVISVLFPYFTKQDRKNVSLYAVVSDYHKVIEKKLSIVCEMLKEDYPQNSFVCFVDNSPVKEVLAAAYAGLGVIGKNNLLINEKYGSFVFIGEIVTDLEIEYSCHEIKGCIDCGKCVSACPSDNLKSFEREMCLSRITQKKSELTQNEKALIKRCGSAWGCDICSIVCPMNEGVQETDIEEFLEDMVPVVTAENLKSLKNRAFSWRPDEVILRNIEIVDPQKTIG